MTILKMSPEKAVLLLNERLDAITELGLKNCSPGYYDLLSWCSKTWSAVEEIFGSGDYRTEEIRLIGVPPCNCCKPGGTPMQMEIYYSHLQKYIGEIQALPDTALPDQR